MIYVIVVYAKQRHVYNFCPSLMKIMYFPHLSRDSFRGSNQTCYIELKDRVTFYLHAAMIYQIFTEIQT